MATAGAETIAAERVQQIRAMLCQSEQIVYETQQRDERAVRTAADTMAKLSARPTASEWGRARCSASCSVSGGEILQNAATVIRFSHPKGSNC